MCRAGRVRPSGARGRAGGVRPDARARLDDGIARASNTRSRRDARGKKSVRRENETPHTDREPSRARGRAIALGAVSFVDARATHVTRDDQRRR